jgi:hypothetical protein
MPVPGRGRQGSPGHLCFLLDQHLLHVLGQNLYFGSPLPPPAHEQRQR